MGRKIGFGLLWFVVIYLGSCFVVGGIAGAIAGGDDPKNAYVAGQIAGSAAVQSLRIYIFISAALISILGAIKGFLPGTREKTGMQ